MQRTTSALPKQAIYSTSEEPIVFSKYLMDTLLSQGKLFADLFVVYSFYYYTAKWQKTNQPKASTKYVSKGAGISVERVQKAKKKLKEMLLIEDTITRVGSKITGHYIKINFIWTREHSLKAMQRAGLDVSLLLENVEVGLCSHGDLDALETRCIENQTTNALSSVSENALSSDKSIITPNKSLERNEKYFPLAKQLADIIQTNTNVSHPKTQIQSWANDIRLLSTTNKIPIDAIEKVLDWYEKNIGDKYTPVVLCGSSFRTKFAQLQRAIARNSAPDRSSKLSNAYHEEGWKPKKKAKVVY